MSAAVLQDNTKANELADDRELCLHVLTWTALCFTKHTIKIKKGSLKYLLQPFNEAYEDGDAFAGGSFKRAFLLQREIENSVKFDDRPRLDALIADLTDVFAARYAQPLINTPLAIAQFEGQREPLMNDLNRRG